MIPLLQVSYPDSSSSEDESPSRSSGKRLVKEIITDDPSDSADIGKNQLKRIKVPERIIAGNELPANRSKFRRVRARPFGNWRAEIRCGDRKNSDGRPSHLWLGSFKTREEALRAYDNAAAKMYGPDFRRRDGKSLAVKQDSISDVSASPKIVDSAAPETVDSEAPEKED